MDADQLDLKIIGHVVTPGRVLETAGSASAVRSPGSADWTGRPDLRLPSHAGHDANQIAKIVPVGMLFAPSRDGRNHCPEEWTEPDDIAVCLASLTAAVIWLDEELEP